MLNPPFRPLVEILLMNTPLSVANCCILSLSPIRDPWLIGLEGSIATTATLYPLLLYSPISREIRVDLPAPGIPVTPITCALPLSDDTCSNSFRTSILEFSTTVSNLPTALSFPFLASSKSSIMSSNTTPLPSEPPNHVNNIFKRRSR